MSTNMIESAGNVLKGFAKVAGAKLRQNRSGIGMVVGAVLLAGGTVWACSKTEEAKKVVQEAKDTKNTIDETYRHDKEEAGEDEIRVKEITRVRNHAYLQMAGKCAWDLTKLYAGPVGVWSGGLVSVVWSYEDQRQENRKLLADSVLLKKLFDEYRERNRAKIGEEEEAKMYFDAKEDSYDAEEVDPKTGNKKKVKKKRTVIHGNGGSRFARNFTNRTSYEFDVRSYADYFLKLKTEELNRKLKSVPFITVNEVYDEFGMKPEYGRCEDGLDWGWVYNPMDPDGPNEIKVTFIEGYEEFYDEDTDRIVYEPCLRIDLNPQYLRGRI